MRLLDLSGYIGIGLLVLYYTVFATGCSESEEVTIVIVVGEEGFMANDNYTIVETSTGKRVRIYGVWGEKGDVIWVRDGFGGYAPSKPPQKRYTKPHQEIE